ncbi:DNA polymerase kappa [Linum perenne]
MDGVDKEKVQRVVYEMSKGSKYFENEERKEALMKHKVESMRAQCAKLKPSDISHYEKVAEKKIIELEAMRNLSRTWLHVDMDAFYAAVETLANPFLKGRPMAVGSTSMLATANYEARKFGVRAAMPGFIARRLCPELIFVPPDFKKYTHYSELSRKVFQKYDPHFIAASLDEAYLDVTEICKERGITGAEVAEELRRGVFEETGLTCSAGIAPNRLLAKVCSDINKPNGQFVLPNDRVAVKTFISSLPIRKIGGIGKVTEHILRDVFGISICEHLLQKGGLLCALFSRSSADFFLSVGLGLGQTETPQVRSRKSMSSERTFSATNNEMLLFQKLAEIAEMLSADLQKEGLSGRTLTLKLKTASFEVRTRALTLEKFVSSNGDILKHASKLLKAELPVSLRLIGLRVSHFSEEEITVLSDPTQQTLAKFVLLGDTGKKKTGDPSSIGHDTDQHFFNDLETEISVDGNEFHQFEIGDPFNGCHFDRGDVQCTSGNSEKGGLCETSSSKIVDKMDSSKSRETNVLKLKDGRSSIPAELEGSSTGRVENEVPTISDSIPSPNPKDYLYWVDGYKCSLCGIEMPPTFEDERQEHSDFHLAERLQREESSINSTNCAPLRRLPPMDDAAFQSARKRQRKSRKQGNHIPIDTFFAKSNQNL